MFSRSANNEYNILNLLDMFLILPSSRFLRWLVKDILFRDHFLCFEFTNSKFRVYKHEISSLQTRNFEFTNTKFRVYKHEISSLQTRNFEFTNTKFRVYKLEISSLQTRNFEFSNSKFRFKLEISCS